MNLLGYIVIVFGAIYGLLNIIAGLTQIKQKKVDAWCSITMIIGGLLVIVSTILSYKEFYFFYTLLIGLILIHIATINNGLKMYSKINLKHHIVRFFISMTLIILFMIK